MLKMRLKRVGRKHDPSFRIVITENTASPKGKYKEAVGFYNSALKQLSLNKDRVTYWLGVGAQPTNSVHNILVREGVVDAPKRRAHSTRVRKKGGEEEAEKQESNKPGEQEGKEEQKEEPKEEPKDEKKEEVPDKEEKEEAEDEGEKKEEAPKEEKPNEEESKEEESKTEEKKEEKKEEEPNEEEPKVDKKEKKE